MREMLIELLSYFGDGYIAENRHIVCDTKISEIADYLIANGVTLATDNNVGSKWIPVSERLPEKMGQYLCRYVFGENTEYPFIQVLGYYTAVETPHFQNEGILGLRVTHWMQLPEPPKEDE